MGGVCSGLALLLAESLTSHAFSEPHPFLPVLADWVHLVMMSVWVGGLAYFVAGLREIRQVEGKPRTALTSRLIVHFSTLALICVGLLGNQRRLFRHPADWNNAGPFRYSL